MNKEAPILGITRKIVDLTEKEAEPFFINGDEKTMLNFIRKTSKLIAKEHPNLYEFVRNPSKYVKVFDPLIYGLGVAFAYSMLSRSLPEEQRKMDIPKDVFAVFHQNIMDSLEIEDNESGNPTINLNWFVDKITKDSRDFSEWLGTMVSGIEEKDSKSDFIMGVTFVIMPFYMQEEARRLSASLFRTQE